MLNSLAIESYRTAAAGGDVVGMYNLATSLEAKIKKAMYPGLPASVGPGAIDIAVKRAPLSDAALEALRTDAADVMRFYKRTAEAGYGMGMFNLATVYQSGILVPRDCEAARRWFARAAASERPDVRRTAATMLELLPLIIKSESVAQDPLLEEWVAEWTA